MVGNDIIDLHETRRTTNWQRPGFLNKVFSVKEQFEISQSANPFQLVWRFWSMKESAYKVAIQRGNKRALNPSALHCETLSETKGMVSFGSLLLHTETTTNEAYIMSLASEMDLENCLSRTLYLPQKDNKKIRQSLHEQIALVVAQHKQWNMNELAIQKTSANVPYITYKNEVTATYLSISHHGKYGAFSLHIN